MAKTLPDAGPVRRSQETRHGHLQFAPSVPPPLRPMALFGFFSVKDHNCTVPDAGTADGSITERVCYTITRDFLLAETRPVFMVAMHTYGALPVFKAISLWSHWLAQSPVALVTVLRLQR